MVIINASAATDLIPIKFKTGKYDDFSGELTRALYCNDALRTPMTTITCAAATQVPPSAASSTWAPLTPPLPLVPPRPPSLPPPYALPHHPSFITTCIVLNTCSGLVPERGRLADDDDAHQHHYAARVLLRLRGALLVQVSVERTGGERERERRGDDAVSRAILARSPSSSAAAGCPLF